MLVIEYRNKMYYKCYTCNQPYNYERKGIFHPSPLLCRKSLFGDASELDVELKLTSDKTDLILPRRKK